jgi:hypothetical protein
MINEVKKSIKEMCAEFGKLLGQIGVCFLSTLFIWWGWNTLAYHLNLFTLGYWEVFAIRMGFANILSIIGKTFKK